MATTKPRKISCECGRAYALREWNALRVAARWPTETGAAELRVCTCGAAILRRFVLIVSDELCAVDG